MLSKVLGLISVVSAIDPCCEICPEGQIKAWSVNKMFGMCGESCMEPKDYWKYKIFEPGMQKANSTTEAVCEELGYGVYRSTEVHGIPHIFDVTVDLYKPTPANQTEIDLSMVEKIAQMTESVKAAVPSIFQ